MNEWGMLSSVCMTSLSGALQYLLMEFPCDSCPQVIFLSFLFSLTANQMPWLNKDKEQHAKRIVALWGNSNNPNYCLVFWRADHVKTVEFEPPQWLQYTQRPCSLPRSPVSHTQASPGNQCFFSVLPCSAPSLLPPEPQMVFVPPVISTWRPSVASDRAVCAPHRSTLLYFLISVRWHHRLRSKH